LQRWIFDVRGRRRDHLVEPSGFASNNGMTNVMNERSVWSRGIKRIFDFVISLIAFVIFLPVIAICAIAVRVSSRGPAFFCQQRLGYRGRVFTLIKLRTMVADAERETGPVWSGSDDPRVTRLGRFLRDTHFDELPQLLNVLKGDMSLVGPRPERPEIAVGIEQRIPLFSDRLSELPGVTGLAQVRLPPDCDEPGLQRKLAHDLYYIKYGSLGMDFSILLATGMQFVSSIVRGVSSFWSLPSRQRVELEFLPLINPEAAHDTFLHDGNEVNRLQNSPHFQLAPSGRWFSPVSDGSDDKDGRVSKAAPAKSTMQAAGR
jgi:lipopolysaccharide/colanic/teichoic acid biosynthesis glycosyltransferase